MDIIDEFDKKFYRISEVADIIGVPASTLRFWESKFTVVKPRRNSHGTRFYTPSDIETIRMIYYLVKDKGLKLDAAQEQIRNNRQGVSRRFEVIERLQSIRSELQDMLNALQMRNEK